MKNKNDDIDFIEQYLDGTLTESEQLDFKKRLEDDPEFRKLYQFRTKISEKWEEANKYAEIKIAVSEAAKNNKKQIKQRTLYWVAAILIILIIIPGIFIINPNEPKQLVENNNISVKINKPENKASLNYNDNSYSQISPSNNQTLSTNDTVAFEWLSDLDVKTAIIVKQQNSDSLIVRIPINSSTKKYKADFNIKPGKYRWELEGFEGSGNFVVTK